MLIKSRGTEEYAVYLTSREKRIEQFFAREKTKKHRFKVVYPASDGASVSVHLGTPVKD